MSQVFDSYHTAREVAQERADRIGLDSGIRREREYGREVFIVTTLPAPHKRFVHEARAEPVQPRCPRRED